MRQLIAGLRARLGRLRAEDVRAIRGDVLRLAWPTITEQVLIMTVGIVVQIFIGHLRENGADVGEYVLPAVGFVNMFVAFLVAFFEALSTGCTVLVARLTGEGDHGTAHRAVAQSLTLSVAFAVT